MLHTEETVRAGIRVKDGSRVYYLPEGDRLTPSARDWLRNENVRILRPQDAPPKVYTTLFGGTLTGKPEHMTHLYGNVLVPKDHPRIAFRGMIDALEAEILLCQNTAAQEKHTELVRALQEILDFVRSLIRADVLGEPVAEVKLCGLDAQALREVYGRPFELAAGVCRAARLPETSISGRTLTENSPLLRAWLLDCGYGGMLWGDRTLAGDRIGLEKAALRILRLILQLKKA